MPRHGATAEWAPDDRQRPVPAESAGRGRPRLQQLRLEIGQIVHGLYRRVDYLKDTVRLGAGLDDRGLLTDEAVERGLAGLRAFASRLAGFAPGQVRAVATQTLREARNRDAFLRRAEAVLGHPIEVISGREEARLIFAGVAFLQPSERPRLVLPLQPVRDGAPVEPPPLIRAYLRCGARLLGAPAWDPGFNVADLPLMVRMSDLPERWRSGSAAAVR